MPAPGQPAVLDNISNGIPCPACSYAASRVIDSRPIEGGGIRRRRRCLGCDTRWTTYERSGDAILGTVGVSARAVIAGLRAQIDRLERLVSGDPEDIAREAAE